LNYGKEGYLHPIDAESGKLVTETDVTTHLNDKAPITLSGTHACTGPLRRY
jgi:hypothetical protein